jgi:tRNA threonylcarbamoyladenosine biosynthesis protein TsaB
LEEGLLTLGVDTSTELRSVVLVRGAQLLACVSGGLREGGSANLLADIDRVLTSASLSLKEVELFASTVGPGSFTGLRSGLATVKGLALTTGKPAVGVPTLHAVAYGVRPASRALALIPAGRGEVFAQLLSLTAEGVVKEQEAPTHMSPERLVEKAVRLGGGLKWVGGGAVKFRGLIEQGAAAAGLRFVAQEASGEVPPDAWAFAEGEAALAEGVVALARTAYYSKGAEGSTGLDAIYVRPSDAELKGPCHAQN